MSRFSLKNISFSQVISIIFIILALIFITQNLSNTPINFLVWRFEIPLFIVIASSFFIGFFTAIVFGMGKNQEVIIQNIPENTTTPENHIQK